MITAAGAVAVVLYRALGLHDSDTVAGILPGVYTGVIALFPDYAANRRSAR